MAIRGGLPLGFRCNCEGFLGFPRGFVRVSDKTALSHAAKTKKECKGIWSQDESSPRISRGISGLVVEYIVAIDVIGFDSRLMHIVLMSGVRVRW